LFSRQIGEGKKIIQGRCKIDTLNDNISMAMYALVDKL
jgi:hypothetical protein